MFRRSVLICALVFCAPMIYAAAVDETVSLPELGIRYLIAIPVAAILIALVRGATSSAKAENDREETEAAQEVQAVQSAESAATPHTGVTAGDDPSDPPR